MTITPSIASWMPPLPWQISHAHCSSSLQHCGLPAREEAPTSGRQAGRLGCVEAQPDSAPARACVLSWSEVAAAQATPLSAPWPLPRACPPPSPGPCGWGPLPKSPLPAPRGPLASAGSAPPYLTTRLPRCTRLHPPNSPRPGQAHAAGVDCGHGAAAVCGPGPLLALRPAIPVAPAGRQSPNPGPPWGWSPQATFRFSRKGDAWGRPSASAHPGARRRCSALAAKCHHAAGAMQRGTMASSRLAEQRHRRGVQEFRTCCCCADLPSPQPPSRPCDSSRCAQPPPSLPAPRLGKATIICTAHCFHLALPSEGGQGVGVWERVHCVDYCLFYSCHVMVSFCNENNMSCKARAQSVLTLQRPARRSHRL